MYMDIYIYIYVLTYRHSKVGDIYRLRASYKFAYGLLGRPGISKEKWLNLTSEAKSLPVNLTSEAKSLPVNLTSEAKSLPVVEILPEADLEYLIGMYMNLFVYVYICIYI
jgi:hypothetical protein